MLEVNQGVLDKGLARVKKFLDDGVAKGKVAAEARDRTLANLAGTTSYEDLADCDIVIEAIIENLDAKRSAYAAVEAVVGDARDPVFEHVVAVHHRTRRDDDAARTGSPGCTSSTPSR